MKLLLGLVAFGAVISALYGLAMTAFGDPFMTFWIILGKASSHTILGVVGGGRMAGLSSHINASATYSLQRHL